MVYIICVVVLHEIRAPASIRINFQCKKQQLIKHKHESLNEMWIRYFFDN